MPQNGSYWVTLGAAHYGTGDWQAAVVALEKGALLPGGWSNSAEFLLAEARWQLGDKEQARKWYERAVARFERHELHYAELRRLRAETEQVLGLRGQKP